MASEHDQKAPDGDSDESRKLDLGDERGEGDERTVARTDLPLSGNKGETEARPADQPDPADKTRVSPADTPTQLSDLDSRDSSPNMTQISSSKAAEATVASAELKPSEKPTKVSPEPEETRTNQDLRVPTFSESGTQILNNRYRIEKTLGRGGFGAAYLATDMKLGQRGCVVKQMLIPKGTPAPQVQLYQANFEREANLLAQLNHPGHPNIPEIYDYFSTDSGNYLVMKYIEGDSLKGIIKDGPIPWREAVRYIIDMADALTYMHVHSETEPVMHRDIKPDNIVLGNDNRVWLLDFGLAKADVIEGAGDVNASLAAGTLGYTPLEQWLGEAVPASDVYALGATLHHLLTGISPAQNYGGTFNLQNLQKLHSNLTPLRQINKEIPKEIQAIIDRATAVKPTERLSPLQLKEQLEALISGGQAAALYTFKSGASATTEQELVDLCEKYRQEAQEYLEKEDFERWFRLINRNDLAEAAVQARQRGKNQKDALEKFLKLLLPNLALRRLRRTTGRLTRAVIIAGLIAVIVISLVAVAGSFAAQSFVEQTISSYEWDFNALHVDQENSLSEAGLNERAQQIAGVYFNELYLDIKAPDRVDVNGDWGGVSLNLPVTIQLHEGKPRLALSEINQIPLFLIGDNLSRGLNGGIDAAFQNSPVDFTTMAVSDEKITVKVAQSQADGRPALPTATPTSTTIPTATPVPAATPTLEGLALVTIFNETGVDIILNIDGKTIEMAADDTEVIEKKPGTYSYTVTFTDSGAVGAEGQKTWAVQTYKWRIRN